jgi:hypothetical protein
MAKMRKKTTGRKKRAVVRSRKNEEQESETFYEIDPAEIIALRAIVMTLVGAMVIDAEKSGVSKDAFIGRFADACLTGIENAKITGLVYPEWFRRTAANHVADILGTVIFDPDNAD